MAIEYKDEKVVEKALGILEREMSLVEKINTNKNKKRTLYIQRYNI